MTAQMHILRMSDDAVDPDRVPRKQIQRIELFRKTSNRLQLFSKKGLTKGESGVIIYESFKEAMLERRCGGIGRRPGLKIP